MAHWWQHLKATLGIHRVDNISIDSLEKKLLAADFGTQLTQHILETWRKDLQKSVSHSPEMHRASLEKILSELLNYPLPPFKKGQCITLWGINGVGKTTTAAKIAFKLQNDGYSVLLGACDTFRAAASEQLSIWAQRIGCGIVKQHPPADSASVAFDTLSAQKNRQIDFSVLDTAGRIHHNQSLQQQSQKILRVLQKIDPTAPHHRILILDAHLGQNSLSQAEHFHAAVQLTGIIITKWDGGAKAGFIAQIGHTLQLPIYYIGSGEHIESLESFDLHKFINKLLA